jgi:hypothetical protein
VARYSDTYGCRVAYACRYAAGHPNGDAFPKVRCYALFTCLDALADAHNDERTNEHANAPADNHSDTNTGSHTYTDLASDDL